MANQLAEMSRPTPKAKEILIKIRATPLNFGDVLARNRVLILGSEFAGEVADVGQAATLFKKGDQVFGYRGPAMGAYAEYLRMPENGVELLRIADFLDSPTNGKWIPV